MDRRRAGSLGARLERIHLCAARRRALLSSLRVPSLPRCVYHRAMPAAGDDIESRLSVVERDVVELRQQLALTSSEAAAARVLAAGADRDVSEVRAELRAHTQALNALRETQVDFARQLADHGRRIDSLDRTVDSLSRKVDQQGREMREGFATLATGMAQITALLTNLDDSRGPE